MRVGYNAPIDFNPGALTHLLATTRPLVQKVLAMFSRQYTLPTHVDSSTSAERQSTDKLLLSEVIPQLNINFMAITPMERHFGAFCYINHSAALVPQVTGSLSPSTP